MKKRIIILGTIVLLVVAAWTGGWFFLAGQVRQNIEAQALADGIESPRVTCGSLRVSGFPFRFDVDCSDATILSGDIEAQVPGIRASVMVYRPTHFLASAKGPATVTDAFTGMRNEIAWSGLEASLRVWNWRIERLSIVGHDVAWSDTLVGNSVIARATQLEAHLLDVPEQHDSTRHIATLAGYMSTKALAYPGLTLADTNADVELELSGLPDDIRNWEDPQLPLVWQRSGGQLKIVSIRGSDGQSTLDAEGTLGLDAAGNVDGSIAVASNGVAERIGPYLEEPVRTLVLGNPTADGSYKNLLNFKAGALFSGMIPIAQIPPLY